MLYEELTDRILKAFYSVYNSLGHGFLEKVYRKSLALELRELGLLVEEEHPIQVLYKGFLVGDYFADLVVNRSVILELKAAETLKPEHFAQLTNYLKATEMELGLLLNFGSKPDFKRIVYTNDHKPALKKAPAQAETDTRYC